MSLGFRELRTWVLALVVVLVVASAGCSDDAEPTTTAPATSTTVGRELPESPPEESLTPRRQFLYRECDEGNDEACTELATITDEDSVEYRFAVTCGERETAPLCAPPEQ